MKLLTYLLSSFGFAFAVATTVLMSIGANDELSSGTGIIGLTLCIFALTTAFASMANESNE